MATAIFFHAHPDDESIATGGTMALAADAGHRIVLVLATRGECGEPVDGVLAADEALGDRRSDEVYRSAAILGVDRVEFLGYRDSGMIGEPTNDEPTCFWQADVEEAAGRLAAILQEERADVLTIYDDHGGYGHPDHIQVHRVGLRAAARAKTATVFEATMNRDVIMESIDMMLAAGIADEALVERRQAMEKEPFGSEDRIITHRVDVTSVLDRKRKSMAAHASQIGPEAFFLAMPDDQFSIAFGAEYFIARRAPLDEADGAAAAGHPDRVGEYVTSLL